MSTITPNGDNRQSVNYTAINVGDKVIQLNAGQLSGTVTEVNVGGDPTQIAVALVDGTVPTVAVTSVRRL